MRRVNTSATTLFNIIQIKEEGRDAHTPILCFHLLNVIVMHLANGEQ
jgi:hypothetical protein